jgi:hypothetical protein
MNVFMFRMIYAKVMDFLIQLQLYFSYSIYFEQVYMMYSNKFQVSLLDLMKMNQHHEMVAKQRL